MDPAVQYAIALFFAGALFGIVPELIVGYFVWRKWFARSNQERYVQAGEAGAFDGVFSRLSDPITARIGGIEAKVTSIEHSLVTRLDQIDGQTADWQNDFVTWAEALPKQLHAVVMSVRGIETNKLQAELMKQYGPLEDELERREQMIMMDPAVQQNVLLQQILESDVSEKFADEHPGQTFGMRYGKAMLLQNMGLGGSPLPPGDGNRGTGQFVKRGR